MMYVDLPVKSILRISLLSDMELNYDIVGKQYQMTCYNEHSFIILYPVSNFWRA
jgi:hypothetical protein